MRYTFSCEQSLLDELREVAKEAGKKQSQIIREALEDFLDIRAADNEYARIQKGESTWTSMDAVEKEYFAGIARDD